MYLTTNCNMLEVGSSCSESVGSCQHSQNLEMIIIFMNVSVNCRNRADISITICVTVGPH